MKCTAVGSTVVDGEFNSITIEEADLIHQQHNPILDQDQLRLCLLMIQKKMVISAIQIHGHALFHQVVGVQQLILTMMLFLIKTLH